MEGNLKKNKSLSSRNNFIINKKFSKLKISSTTRLFSLIGDPIEKSLSPIMFNTLFEYFNYDAVYLAFKVKNLHVAISAIKELNICGCSVTMPHKVSVINHLDYLDECITKIGSVNTIVNKNGILTGHNFDYIAAIEALNEKVKIKNRKVVIIGAGGAARALGYGIKKKGGKIIIINRTKSRGQLLALKLGCDFNEISELMYLKFDILINATPIGMYPNISTMPIPKEILKPNIIVMDLVYNPFRTKLLKSASDIGCLIIDGIEILARQGRYQFEYWTGLKVTFGLLKKILLSVINN